VERPTYFTMENDPATWQHELRWLRQGPDEGVYRGVVDLVYYGLLGRAGIRFV